MSNKANFVRFCVENEGRRENDANSRRRDCRVASLLAITGTREGPVLRNEANSRPVGAGERHQCYNHRQAGACRCHPRAGQGRKAPVADCRGLGMSNEANLPLFWPKNRGRVEKQSQFGRVLPDQCRSYSRNPRRIPRPNGPKERYRPGEGSCRGRTARCVKQTQFADGCAGRRFTSSTTMAARDCFPGLREGTLASLLAITGMGCGCHCERALPSAAISSVAYLAKRGSRSEVPLWKRVTEEMADCGAESAAEAVAESGRTVPEHVGGIDEVYGHLGHVTGGVLHMVLARKRGRRDNRAKSSIDNAATGERSGPWESMYSLFGRFWC